MTGASLQPPSFKSLLLLYNHKKSRCPSMALIDTHMPTLSRSLHVHLV